MIKVITWIDDGREEITTVTATAASVVKGPPATSSSWEGLHQQFVARLREREES